MPKVVVLTSRAKRDYEKLDKSSQVRVKSRLRDLELEPLKYSKRLANAIAGTYRARAGDIRIVFDIEGNEVIVLRIGNRRDIYKH